VKQLAPEVVRRKYKTSSKNLPALLQNTMQGLVKRRLLRRASRKKGYTLGKEVPATPTNRTTRSPQAAPKNGRRTRRPPSTQERQKQQLPLHTVLTNLLAKSKRPLTARELADQVLTGGYQA
jgi:hypothetical protein